LIATAIPVVGQLKVISVNKENDVINPLTNGDKWVKTFGGKEHDVGSSIKQTTDGGYILTGSDQSKIFQYRDLWLIKTDENGNVPTSHNRSLLKYRLFELFPNLFRILEKFLTL